MGIDNNRNQYNVWRYVCLLWNYIEPACECVCHIYWLQLFHLLCVYIREFTTSTLDRRDVLGDRSCLETLGWDEDGVLQLAVWRRDGSAAWTLLGHHTTMDLIWIYIWLEGYCLLQ
jgi:hypothetical protein